MTTRLRQNLAPGACTNTRKPMRHLFSAQFAKAVHCLFGGPYCHVGPSVCPCGQVPDGVIMRNQWARHINVSLLARGQCHAAQRIVKTAFIVIQPLNIFGGKTTYNNSLRIRIQTFTQNWIKPFGTTVSGVVTQSGEREIDIIGTARKNAFKQRHMPQCAIKKHAVHEPTARCATHIRSGYR